METVSIKPATLKATGAPVITLKSPYHPDCAARAKALGGRWNGDQKQWVFDPRDEPRVREMARELYGTDGSAAEVGDTVTCKVTWNIGASAGKGGIYWAGRCIAYATGRDSGARLGDGVICLSEKKPDSSGSMKNWSTDIPSGTVLEIRDLPRAAVRRAITENTPIRQACWHPVDADCTGCPNCGGLRYTTPVPLLIEVLDDVETPAEVVARMGSGMEASPLEQTWTAIQALAIDDQVELRNRLLAAL